MLMVGVLYWAGPAIGQAPGDDGMLVDPNSVSLENPAPASPRPPRTMIPAPSSHRPVPPGQPTYPGARPPATQPTPPVLTGPQPLVEFENPEYDFGTVLAGKPVEHEFLFKNVGEATLVLETVQAGCGCTAVEWDKQIEPGKSGKIKAQLRTQGYNGKVRKPITVTTNDWKHRTTVLTLAGEIRAPYTMTPAYLSFGPRLLKDSVAECTAKITNNLPKPLVLKDAKVDSPMFRATLKEVEPGKVYEVTVATVPPLREGPIPAKLIIETDNPELPKIEQNFSPYVMPRLSLMPPSMSLPDSVTVDITRIVTLRNEGPTPVHVTNVTSTEQAIQTELRTKVDGKQYEILLKIPKGTSLENRGAITIATDDSEISQLVLPVIPYKTRPMGPTAAPGMAPTTQHALGGPRVIHSATTTQPIHGVQMR